MATVGHAWLGQIGRWRCVGVCGVAFAAAAVSGEARQEGDSGAAAAATANKSGKRVRRRRGRRERRERGEAVLSVGRLTEEADACAASWGPTPALRTGGRRRGGPRGVEEAGARRGGGPEDGAAEVQCSRDGEAEGRRCPDSETLVAGAREGGGWSARRGRGAQGRRNRREAWGGR